MINEISTEAEPVPEGGFDLIIRVRGDREFSANSMIKIRDVCLEIEREVFVSLSEFDIEQ